LTRSIDDVVSSTSDMSTSAGSGGPTSWSIRRTATAYRHQALSPMDILGRHLKRIARVDADLNAFVAIDAADAAKAAAASTERFSLGRPLSILDGIPVALKDNIDVAGLPTTNGAAVGRRADGDADIVSRLRASGAVVIGKLNMHEGALGATTDNPHHGPTQNPWRHGFTPGGSSGGCAAAVAAGLVKAAIGTDTLGSVRIPAAYCGIVGFKPTKGVFDMMGIAPLSPSLDQVGPLCRDIDDIGAVMAVLADVPAFDDPPANASASRVGVVDPLCIDGCETDTRTAYAAALDAVSAVWPQPEAVDLGEIEFATLRRHALIFIEAEAAEALAPTWDRLPYAYSDSFRAMLAYGRDAAPARVAAARGSLAAAGEIVRSILARIDFLVLPATPQSAFDFAADTPPNQGDFTGLANMAGCPAIVVPTGVGEDGMPTSVQLLAAPGRDVDLVMGARRLAATWPPIFPPL